MRSETTTILVEGLTFPECPRWHEGRLWFSDMHAHWVMATDLQGHLEPVAEVPGKPAGLGWLPDGRLLVVSMTDRRLLRLDPEGLTEVADLSAIATYHCNDMVVDDRGRAYLGNFGFDLYEQHPFVPAEIVLVDSNGRARIVASDMAFPNGTVITPDGRTLIVAESWAQRLTAFDIEPGGTLHRRRVWADIPDATPDGICLDEDDAIWVASPLTGEVLRCREGGEITHRIQPRGRAYACMLGGPDRRTLFVLTAETMHPTEASKRPRGMVETLRVEVPGAGLP